MSALDFLYKKVDHSEYDPSENYELCSTKKPSKVETCCIYLGKLKLTDIGTMHDYGVVVKYLTHLKNAPTTISGVKYLLQRVPKQTNNKVVEFTLPKTCDIVSGFRVPGLLACHLEKVRMLSRKSDNKTDLVTTLFDSSNSFGPAHFVGDHPYTEQYWDLGDNNMTQFYARGDQVERPWFFVTKNSKWWPNFGNVEDFTFVVEVTLKESCTTPTDILKLEVLAATLDKDVKKTLKSMFIDAVPTINKQGNLELVAVKKYSNVSYGIPKNISSRLPQYPDKRDYAVLMLGDKIIASANGDYLNYVNKSVRIFKCITNVIHWEYSLFDTPTLKLAVYSAQECKQYNWQIDVSVCVDLDYNHESKVGFTRQNGSQNILSFISGMVALEYKQEHNVTDSEMLATVGKLPDMT